MNRYESHVNNVHMANRLIVRTSYDIYSLALSLSFRVTMYAQLRFLLPEKYLRFFHVIVIFQYFTAATPRFNFVKLREERMQYNIYTLYLNRRVTRLSLLSKE